MTLFQCINDWTNTKIESRCTSKKIFNICIFFSNLDQGVALMEYEFNFPWPICVCPEVIILTGHT